MGFSADPDFYYFAAALAIIYLTLALAMALDKRP